MHGRSLAWKAAFLSLLAAGALQSSPAPAESAAPLTVFAAASTTNAITDVAALFEAENKTGKPVLSFAASSTLARQIESGAPANVFLSADEKWMDYLTERRLVEPGTRADLLGNRLVLIAPSGSAVTGDVRPGFPLAKWLAGGHLAMGDPAHVPAGTYGKAALEALGVWDSVKGSVVPADSVRGALAFVERGETPLGVVYETDAAISKKVKVVGVFPEGSSPPVVYPVGLVAGKATPEARAFIEFLKSPDARKVFKKYGFSVR